MVHVLSGKGVVRQNEQSDEVVAGDCIAWAGGTGIAHSVVNPEESAEDLVLFEFFEVRPPQHLTSFTLIRSLHEEHQG